MVLLSNIYTFIIIIIIIIYYYYLIYIHLYGIIT